MAENIMTFSLIEANVKMDAGEIYYKKKIKFDKGLIFDEIKQLQFEKSLELLIKLKKFYKKNKKAPISK